MFRVAAVLYAALALFSAGVAALAREGHPLTHPSPWVRLGEREAVAASVVLGVALAAAVVGSARLFLRRYEWAKGLASELRPFARGLTPWQIVALAALSSAGEELFFRALLGPSLGVVLSSVLFGAAHQIRGPSRWVWAGWAAVVGLAMGAIFAATGSLWGPLVAHAAINGMNLRLLRDSDPGGQERKGSLGGLLRGGRGSGGLRART